MSYNETSKFEEFVFHDSFGILLLATSDAFSEMADHIGHCFEIIGDVWSDGDQFFEWHTILSLMATGFFGSIGLSYIVITPVSIILTAAIGAMLFCTLTTLFALYQVIVGIGIGIYNAFKSYFSALFEYTFGK